MKLAISLAIPMLLIIAGVLLLLGCLSIPASRQLQPNFKPRPEFAVGTGADKPIRLGYTHIDDAFIELNHQVQDEGPGGWADLGHLAMRSFYGILNHWSVSPDGTEFAVRYDIRTATVFNCFPIATSDTQAQFLVLKVNANHVVTATRTTDRPPFSPVPLARWLEVFDPPTRSKLHAAGVFPSGPAV